MIPKRIVIIAGPNGAGKSTFAEAFLLHEAGMTDFLNADLIARGLSPFAPDQAAIRAGRLLLEEIERRVREGRSFAFETTLRGLNYSRRIPRWQALGYHVKLVFLGLPTADLAVGRVKIRVLQGGHDIPEDVVRRRFDGGLRNFERIYRTLVNSWVLYNNAGDSPRVISGGDNP